MIGINRKDIRAVLLYFQSFRNGRLFSYPKSKGERENMNKLVKRLLTGTLVFATILTALHYQWRRFMLLAINTGQNQQNVSVPVIPNANLRMISGNPRQFNYRDESAGLCISAHWNNIIIPLPFDINAVTGIQLVENMFDFYCMFPVVMLYYMYERKSNTL